MTSRHDPPDDGAASAAGHLKTLAATRCTLEPQVAAHAHEMFAVLADPAIYEFENAPPPSEQWLAARFRRLESRASTDGTQQWLNWVIRLPGGALAGYVQATVLADRCCLVAYELNSRYWRQGIGSSAVTAMLHELQTHGAVDTFVAVLKATNFRSAGLLRKLGFSAAGEAHGIRFRDRPDEVVFVKNSGRRGA